MLDSAIFRTYDIRGIVGETLDEERVKLIGHAIGSHVRGRGGLRLAVARDGRLSSESFQAALIEGLLLSGCDVVNVGRVPTPLLYFAANEWQLDAGVMVTGSHNPANYNGFKVIMHGQSLTAEEIQSIYQRAVSGDLITGSGSVTQRAVEEQYLATLMQQVACEKPLKIVIDAGNGVTGELAPRLFRALGCEVIELYCDIDGRFPNHHPDPCDAKNLVDLVAAVKAHQAAIGLAFDGDGDRLGMVASSGEIICADRLLMVFARALLKNHPGAKVVFDVKCTNQLAKLITDLGGNPLMWKTGHSLIKAKMLAENALLGGEMSGHFFFRDEWYGFDDALYAGARLLRLLAQQGEAIFADLPNSFNTPELKIAVPEEKKFAMMQQLLDQAHFPQAQEINDIDGLRINFADGWGLVRPSNTTPYLILRFEANNQHWLEQIQMLFKQWLLSVHPECALPF